jgi:hypothetical protein
VLLAENALFNRSRDLGSANDAAGERLAIQIAQRDLLLLKIEKPGWSPLDLNGEIKEIG